MLEALKIESCTCYVGYVTFRTRQAAFTVPGPRMGAGSRTLARDGDGARNGAGACTTYCRDNASSRAVRVTATIRH
jgi:hypothetical protein